MRVINFSAGPAGLPQAALEKARDELLDFEGSGMSIMEQSHRGKEYDRVHNEAIALLRDLLGVPEDFHVLFLQGGASMQFAMVPLNFLQPGRSADYVLTGGWSEKALDEAKRVGQARVACSTKTGSVYTRIPRPEELALDPSACYVHLTSNNTLYGTQWQSFPTTEAPLVADMSSDFLWRRFDVRPFSLIYAGAQKNIGPSGVTVVLVRKDFLEKAERGDGPKILRYSTHANANSLYNTPPTFGVYLVRNVLEWAKSVGGLEQLEKWNREKGEVLYGALDRMSDFYRSPVEKESRSFMNVVFRLPDETLEERFVAEAKQNGMVGLKGHRSTGGIRASIYNAVTVEHVKTLVSFMEQFAKKNG